MKSRRAGKVQVDCNSHVVERNQGQMTLLHSNICLANSKCPN